ncbi:MAG: hypothetical protein ABR595_04365 [Psychroflexus sp.]
MKTRISTFVIPILLVTIIACKGEKKKKQDEKIEAPTEQQIKEVKKMEVQKRRLSGCFETFDGTYNEEGEYQKTIAVPNKTMRINGNDELLNLTRKSVRGLQNDSVFVVFELFQHGKGNTDDLCNETKKDTTYNGDLNSLFNDFEPIEEKTVFVVSLHDEDFQNYRTSDLEDLHEYLLETATDCLNQPENCTFSQDEVDDILGDHDNNIKMPRRIGNGVLIPKFK